MAIAGAREMESGDVSVRRHGRVHHGNMKLDLFIGMIEEEISQATT